VHTNGVKAHIVGTLAAPRDARLVWHIHEYVRSRPWSARLLRGLASRAWAIVANSDSVADDVRAAWGTALPVRRIYNAVDLTVFHPDGRALDLASAAGLPDAGDRIRIGLVATFGRWKGHDVFVEAISRLTPRDRVRAYVIGGPVYETAGSQYSRTELQRAVAARGLSGTIGFTGHVDDVAAAMRALDIVVHASTQPEPFGMVIAEAMAAGRPVVAARAGGAKELFDDGATGVGHAMGDAGDLAACLQALLDDPARRRALGCAARRAAAARFSAARMAAEFAQVYSG
jgi:glycosyltransferase involved in cell wall biosynthesis